MGSWLVNAVALWQLAVSDTTVEKGKRRRRNKCKHQHQQCTASSSSCTGPTEKYGEAGRQAGKQAYRQAKRNSSPRLLLGLDDLDDQHSEGKHALR